MRSYPSLRYCARWYTALVVLAFILSIALGGAAISADDPATATPNNSVGSLGAPPPTNTPAPTIAPTATTAPTVAPATTVSTPAAAPTTAASTPTGTTGAPATTTEGTPAASTSAPSGTPAPAASTTAPTTSNGSIDYDEGGGGPSNIVKVVNKNDGKFRLKGKIQVNRIPGDNAQPTNDAEAYASCANCETFAVALQIDLISRTATTIAPQNVAIAVNVQCSHCTTVAKAVQYVIQVDDPTQVPENVRDLVNQMQNQLKAAAQDKDATAAQTEARVDAVIAQFTQLAQSLSTQRDQKTEDNTPGGTIPPDATP
jgi:putative peptide zinc metalloprotease protein